MIIQAPIFIYKRARMDGLKHVTYREVVFSVGI